MLAKITQQIGYFITQQLGLTFNPIYWVKITQQWVGVIVPTVFSDYKATRLILLLNYATCLIQQQRHSSSCDVRSVVQLNSQYKGHELNFHVTDVLKENNYLKCTLIRF